MSEHDDQCALFDWMEYNKGKCPELELVFAIPNGTRTTIAVGKKMKDEGVKKGVPDIFLPIPRPGYHGMFIEMKFGDNKTSPEQIIWITRLREQGYRAVVCYDWQSAAQEIVDYLEGK